LKILILKPSSLGDVIQALPVLRLLKRHRPEAEIYWWIASELESLVKDDPDLAGTYPFQRKRWIARRNWESVAEMFRDWRSKEFDLVIDLQSLARSGLFAWLANGKLTIGLDDAREGARGFYDIAVPRPARRAHAVDWYLAVLERLGIPIHWSFEWLPRHARIADEVSTRWSFNDARWIAVCPGARWMNKRWPIEHFSDLTKRIVAENATARFAILGGADDRELAAAIVQAAPDRCLDLTGKTSLPEMIEVVRHCESMITNDTGPMHVAAAMGKPIFALFGPTSAHFTGPYGQINQVLRVPLPCAPCLKGECANAINMECLKLVTPEMVHANFRRRSSTTPGISYQINFLSNNSPVLHVENGV
jgi:heptosyltransferase I